MKSVAAIVSDDTSRTDQTVNRMIERLTDEGHNIEGVLQKPLADANQGNRCNATLYNIRQKNDYSISQNVFVNRFGKREANGGGFRPVIEKAMELGVPVLCIVPNQWRSAWLDYGGDSVLTIADSQHALTHWLNNVLMQNTKVA